MSRLRKKLMLTSHNCHIREVIMQCFDLSDTSSENMSIYSNFSYSDELVDLKKLNNLSTRFDFQLYFKNHDTKTILKDIINAKQNNVFKMNLLEYLLLKHKFINKHTLGKLTKCILDNVKICTHTHLSTAIENKVDIEIIKKIYNITEFPKKTKKCIRYSVCYLNFEAYKHFISVALNEVISSRKLWEYIETVFHSADFMRCDDLEFCNYFEELLKFKMYEKNIVNCFTLCFNANIDTFVICATKALNFLLKIIDGRQLSTKSIALLSLVHPDFVMNMFHKKYKNIKSNNAINAILDSYVNQKRNMPNINVSTQSLDLVIYLLKYKLIDKKKRYPIEIYKHFYNECNYEMIEKLYTKHQLKSNTVSEIEEIVKKHLTK